MLVSVSNDGEQRGEQHFSDVVLEAPSQVQLQKINQIQMQKDSKYSNKLQKQRIKLIKITEKS